MNENQRKAKKLMELRPIRKPDEQHKERCTLETWQVNQKSWERYPITRNAYMDHNTKCKTKIYQYDDGIVSVWIYKSTSDANEIGNHLRHLMGHE